MKTLNANECAAFLKVNITTVHILAAKGELPGAKIGRAWVFREEDLDEYLKNEVKRQQKDRQQDAYARAHPRQPPDLPAYALRPEQRPRNKSRPIPKLPELIDWSKDQE